MRQTIIVAAALALWLVPWRAAQGQAQDTGIVRPQSRSTPEPAPACCAIVRIDSSQSIVTARELGTGFTFSFEVRTRRLLRTLKIGSPVWADFTGRTVRLKATDVRGCCEIVPVKTP